MAQRTGTELKVFLEGTLAQYNALTDKTGTVFFDKDNHAVYAKGECIIQSNIKDVTYNPTSTELTITPFTGTPVVINLGIQSELEGLETTLKTWVGNNYVKQVAGSRLMTDGEGTKLAGIDKGAQKNRVITVNNSTFGNDEQTSEIKISGNLISLPGNGEDGVMAVNLDVEYSSEDKKIYFRNGDTDDADNIAEIDVSDFIKDSFVKGGSYDADKKALILTLVTGKNDDGSDKTEPVEIPVGGLIDEYTAGNGLSLSGTTFSAKLGNGLEFDAQKKIKLYPNPNGGIKVDAGGVALKAATNGGIIFGDGGGIAVDFTKAPVQSVNGQTGAVNIDVTPKVWSF